MQINRWALKELRESRGLTQSQLAVEAGISVPYLSRMESGKRLGSPRVIRGLAEALRVPLQALLANPSEREAA